MNIILSYLLSHKNPQWDAGSGVYVEKDGDIQVS